jgi:hypothetical protein
VAPGEPSGLPAPRAPPSRSRSRAASCPVSSRPLYGGPLCSSSRVSDASQWGSRWVVSLLRPPRPARLRAVPARGARGRTPGSAPGPCARGRRRMGSVGGWPLAIPITVASGGNRDGGSPLAGEASRTGPPPAGSPGRTPPPARAETAGARARSPLGNLEWECRSPQGAQAATARSASSRGDLPSVTNLSGGPSGHRRRLAAPRDSYLVDSASSHMLVSKIKPCMSKYKQLYRETANGSLYKLSFI